MVAPPSIGPYRILEKLGVGGMGEVFLAEQREPIRRRVALKLIRPGLDTEQLIGRFESERQALALMDHPGIARVFDAGTTEDGRPYFAMEYVKGEPITVYCDRVRLTMRERAELMIRVCDAVQHAHQRAVIHRDLKPSNVLVAGEGATAQPKIIDFGVAKALAQPLTERTLMTEFGQVLGTPEYMSPEQADTSVDRVDTRTDVYSLGVMFYELLVGALPFGNDAAKSGGLVEVLRRVREVEPARPSTRVSSLGEASTSAAAHRRTTRQQLTSLLRGDLDWIAMRALEKEPGRRYGSPSDFARDIERFLRDEPVLAGPPSTAYRVRKFVRRHRVGVAFAAVTGGLLVALAVSMAVQARVIAAERDKAKGAATAARREARAAQQVSEFLASVFDGADPELTAGRELSARELLDRGAARIRELDDQPSVQSQLRTVIAGVYLTLGAFDVAAPMLEATLAYYQQHPDANRNGHAQTLHLQAMLLDTGRNEPARAEAFAREAVAIWRDLGEGVMASESLNVLGTSLWHQDRIDEASEVFREAIALREHHLGTGTPAIAGPLTNLGSMSLVTGDYATAERAYLRVIAIEEAGEDAERNGSLGTSLHLLALAYEGLGRLQEAIEVERRSLRIREAAWGPDHWHVALSLGALGNMLRATDRAAEAEPLNERAVRIAAATWPKHPDLWWAQRSLARTQVALGKWEPAERAMTAQRDLMTQMGKESWLAEVLEILGAAAHGRDDLAAAEANYRQATEIMARTLDADDEDRLRATRAFAAVLRSSGKGAEAEAIEAAMKHAAR